MYGKGKVKSWGNQQNRGKDKGWGWGNQQGNQQGKGKVIGWGNQQDTKGNQQGAKGKGKVKGPVGPRTWDLDGAGGATIVAPTSSASSAPSGSAGTGWSAQEWSAGTGWSAEEGGTGWSGRKWRGHKQWRKAQEGQEHQPVRASERKFPHPQDCKIAWEKLDGGRTFIGDPTQCGICFGFFAYTGCCVMADAAGVVPVANSEKLDKWKKACAKIAAGKNDPVASPT